MTAANDVLFPPVIFTLWRIALLVTFVVFIPLAVYLLHATYRAARSIDLYARETLIAAAGIAGNTKNIPALDATIGTATEILAAAEAVEAKLDTIATVLGQRAR